MSIYSSFCNHIAESSTHFLISQVQKGHKSQRYWEIGSHGGGKPGGTGKRNLCTVYAWEMSIHRLLDTYSA